MNSIDWHDRVPLMGWWKIDAETGMPLEDSHSAVSKPPEFVLLNALPGEDDDESACYLGDGPWDMASTVPDELEAVTGNAFRLTDEQLLGLLLRRVVPPLPAGCPPEIGEELLQIADALWEDVDSCYEDDWERPAKPAERRWVAEHVLECRTDSDARP